MAEKNQHLKNGADAKQQQQHLDGTVENSTTNNFRQFGYVRDDMRKVFIGGLNGETTERDLEEHFGQFGKIKYINVKVEAVTGLGRGYAFIVFKTIEGMDNALACNNHVINDKKIDLQKALPRHAKLFIGGLCPNLTDDDIIDYFKRYATLVRAQMPYDKVKNQRKRFCFLTFDSMQAVTEILRFSKHVIKGKQVDVKLPAPKVKHYRMMPGATGPMKGIHGNARVQEGYGYYILYTGYSPECSYSYGYPIYIPAVVADYQYGGYEASAPSGVYGNQIVE